MTGAELVAASLRRLRRAARSLPRARRQELAEEIAEHIAQARASGAVPGEGGSAALRNALERLGEPEDIVAAAGGGAHAGRPGRRGVGAGVLVLFGGVAGPGRRGGGGIVGRGAGVVLVWFSPRGRWPDKLLGTLVWPGGFASLFLLAGQAASARQCGGVSGTVTTCSGSPGLPLWLAIAITVAAVAGPVVVAARLL